MSLSDAPSKHDYALECLLQKLQDFCEAAGENIYVSRTMVENMPPARRALWSRLLDDQYPLLALPAPEAA